MITRKKLIIIIVAVILVSSSAGVWAILHAPTTKPATNSNTDATFASVDFYSADIPFETRTAIKEWFQTNSGVSGLNDRTVTVRKGSYSKTYSADFSVVTINFLVDLTGTPRVTYAVHMELSRDGGFAPLAITCPPASDQIGTPSACKGMTQI